MGNLSTLLAELGDRWPECARPHRRGRDRAPAVAVAVQPETAAAAAEEQRVQANEAMAAAFAQVDFVISATNPGPAFPADAATSSADDSFLDWAKTNVAGAAAFRGVMGGSALAAVASRSCRRRSPTSSGDIPGSRRMGALTIISNIYGNPASRSRPAPSTVCRSGCRCSPAHHADGCCSTSRSRPSARCPGRTWRLRKASRRGGRGASRWCRADTRPRSRGGGTGGGRAPTCSRCRRGSGCRPRGCGAPLRRPRPWRRGTPWRVGVFGVDAHRGVVHGRGRALEREGHLCELVLDRLEAADRHPELVTFLGVFERHREDPARGADHLGRE